MKKVLFCIFLILIGTVASAQILCDECAEPGTYWCDMFPDECQQCWDVCQDPVVRKPDTRVGGVAPPESVLDDYELPKTVGAAQIAYSEAWQHYQKAMPHHFTTKELFDEMGHHGLRAVRLWLTVPYWDGVEHPTNSLLYPNYQVFEDMREVWEHPDIDTIMVILTDPAHTVQEADCNGYNSMTLTDDPVEAFARFMFRHFSDQDKTIIIANPEADNQWRGFHCVEPDEINFDTFWGPDEQAECLAENTLEECVYQMAQLRFDYILRSIENRQRIVEEIRELYPDAKLKLRTSVTISEFHGAQSRERLFGMFVLSKIKLMKHKPDYIGLSFWKGANMSLSDAIFWVKRLTGYPAERMIIDQIGQNEKRYGMQYKTLTRLTHEAWDNGINLVLVWIWKSTWRGYTINGASADKGMWSILCDEPEPWCGWGEPNSGLGAIYELNAEVEEEQ